MESDLLIDLAESGDYLAKNEMNKSLESSDATMHLDSFLEDVGVPRTRLTCPPSTERANRLVHSDSTILSPFKSLTDSKALCVHSLSSSNLNCNELPALDSQMKGRAQSLTFDVLNCKDSLKTTPPFGCPKHRSASSLQSVCLLDSEPSKILPPFGFLVSWNDEKTKDGQANEVPVGDLLEVTEEPKLPEDMFDIDVLEKKQSEHLLPPGANAILSTTASNGSGDASSDGIMNRGFICTGSSVDDVFSILDDSVFEEALALAEKFSRMAIKDPSSTVDSIENEDESIVYDSPDWKDENVENDNVAVKKQEDIKRLLEFYAKDKSFDEDVGSRRTVSGSEMKSYSNFALNSIMGTPQQRESKNSSLSSSTSSISPVPLSTNRVDLMRLKAGEIIGSQLSVGPLKLRASSSTAPEKNGPMRAFIPLEQMVQRKTSPSPATNVGKKSNGTPQLKVTFPSPCEKPNKQVLSSTPKLNIPIGHLNSASSMKNQFGNLAAGKNRPSLDSVAKKNSKALSTPSRPRSLSFGKVHEPGNSSATGRCSAKKVPVPSPLHTRKFLNGPVQPCARTIGNPSPVLRKKFASGSPALSTPNRSRSTGCLPVCTSEKVVRSAFQSPALQSQGRCASLSAKLHLNGRPLASINSPAKSSSPLRKLISKFRRNAPFKGMKENVSPT